MASHRILGPLGLQLHFVTIPGLAGTTVLLYGQAGVIYVSLQGHHCLCPEILLCLFQFKEKQTRTRRLNKMDPITLNVPKTFHYATMRFDEEYSEWIYGEPGEESYTKPDTIDSFVRNTINRDQEETEP